ncbi:uncharacterized protein LOC126085027 [Elephas maximus indicus]|uniref:uncharacterized protein LOC126085027 n=1 Tax=Elephas maximus indicus TaxID=99487 RepID=UPI0021172503|nr:uncharacterized protein LOC126085027 [Elephas maximus indicus]
MMEALCLLLSLHRSGTRARALNLPAEGQRPGSEWLFKVVLPEGSKQSGADDIWMKEPGLLGDVSDSMPGHGKHQISLGHLLVSEAKISDIMLSRRDENGCFQYQEKSTQYFTRKEKGDHIASPGTRPGTVFQLHKSQIEQQAPCRKCALSFHSPLCLPDPRWKHTFTPFPQCKRTSHWPSSFSYNPCSSLQPALIAQGITEEPFPLGFPKCI